MYYKANFALFSALAISIIGSVLKLLHKPGANYMLIAGLSSLALAFIIKGVQDKTSEAILEGITKALALLGILFKLMHWEGGNALIAAAVVAGILWAVKAFMLKPKE